MLADAAQRYTPAIFARFQEQYNRSMAYTVEWLGDAICKVYRFEAPDRCTDERRLLVGDGKRSFNCSCAMYENEGLLCRHVLAVICLLRPVPQYQHLRTLQPRYLMPRWCKDAKPHIIGGGSKAPDGAADAEMYAALTRRMSVQAARAASDGVVLRHMSTAFGVFEKTMANFGETRGRKRGFAQGASGSHVHVAKHARILKKDLKKPGRKSEKAKREAAAEEIRRKWRAKEEGV